MWAQNLEGRREITGFRCEAVAGIEIEVYLHIRHIAARGGEDIAETSQHIDDSQDLAPGGLEVAPESSEAQVVETTPQGANGLVPVWGSLAVG